MSELLDRHNRVMGQGAPLFYRDPIELVSGDGVWLTAADGTRYLDLYNNVPCVGHANPRVAEALATQAATLNVNSRYLHPSVVDYVERLLDLHTDGIESTILACSGTEATELAIRIARRTTGHRGIICTDATYHGNSTLVGRLSWLPRGTGDGPIRSISTPQLFRPLEVGLDEAELKQRYLDQLAETIAGFQSDGTGFAGLMLCSILANEGLPDVPDGWFQDAVSLVRESGGVVIADEVQAGFGRSGHLWGYEAKDFTPDIVCMGKPMGNGLPVSAVAAGHEVISAYRQKQRYFNTFAATPLQAAAGTAVLDEIEERDLVSNARTIGGRLKGALTALQPDQPTMGDVRGLGLFIGVDWVHPGTTDPDVAGAKAMVEALKDRGMLISNAGQHGNVLKIRPPLVLEQHHADLFLDAFTDALAAVGTGDPTTSNA
ncbi:MAG: aminotransferase class III-fold pyridoxal phosphate-dependent enzyme [Actinomycetota bacterium]